MSKIVLITGASSGIGLETAKLLCNRGYTVYGVARREVVHDAINYLQADVTDQAQVDAVVQTIIAREGRLDIVIQSAGFGIAGAVEANSDDEIARQMDVNFNGSVRVLRAVLPIMRVQTSGKIIQLGSVAGHIAIPFQGFYSASKFAIAGLYQSLRLELAPFGIQVAVVEPGDTNTNFAEARIFAETLMQEYQEAMNHAVGVMEKDEACGDSPEKAAKLIAKLCRRKKMPARIVVGVDYKLLCAAKAILPYRLVERILKRKYLQ
ncbi:MAG: SDR family oxidoreductase [Oscillospiraceae bacterium]|nr:SDR family oxidoreductase [Oscillospiraceae bacterium]